MQFINWLGCAIAQEVGRWFLIEKSRIRSPVSPCGMFGEPSDSGTGFSPSSSIFSCRYHFAPAPCSFCSIWGTHSGPVSGPVSLRQSEPSAAVKIVVVSCNQTTKS
jgi:hypothetical protein